MLVKIFLAVFYLELSLIYNVAKCDGIWLYACGCYCANIVTLIINLYNREKIAVTKCHTVYF